MFIVAFIVLMVISHFVSCERSEEMYFCCKFPLPLLLKTRILSYIAFLTLWGPCIVIYSYNKSQQDALFLNFILIYNSTCFGQNYCPSSGVLLLYSQQSVFVILVMWTVY